MTRILVVDDKFIPAEGMQRGLQHSGYITDSETSYTRARERILSGGYDLVVCDTELGGQPPRLGFDLLDDVREKGCEVPFIGMSSNERYGREWEKRGTKFLSRENSLGTYVEAIKIILG